VKRPRIAWHDPNFGVRFEQYMAAIEEVVPPGRVDFIAESSLSLLSEPHLRRLRRNGFVGILPGIESWYELGNKSSTGSNAGMDKVRRVADHVNMILRHIPFVQTNFVLGLDGDRGAEPFELTKRFLDLAPGAYPAFSLITAYGRAAPLNLDFQVEGRVIPVPFHFLNSTRSMNVRPRHYAWPDFFARVADLVDDAHSWPRIVRRFRATRGIHSRWFSALRAATSKKVASYNQLRDHLQPGGVLRTFFEGEAAALPAFFTDGIRRDLGPFWETLPSGALLHDHLAYLRSQPGSHRTGSVGLARALA
jgi:hypothetical protein